MTLSIIARCAETGQFGISAATSVPAVGKLLTHGSPGLGAAATQGLLNPYLGIDAIRLLADGMSAQAVVDDLVEGDPVSARRQLAVIDREGRTAVWTGEGCKDWAGHVAGPDYSVQGNRLTGRDVAEAASATFEESVGKPLVDRLVDALAAGLARGGDRLGERSATVYVVDSEEYPLWDVRIDDHDDPIAELYRLKQVFAERLLPHVRKMPTRKHPAGDPGDYDV